MDGKSHDTMGTTKHAKSGRPPKSPKLKHALKREAEKDERKAKRYPMVDSFKQLFGR